MKQLSLIPKSSTKFGGSLLKSNPKTKRPLSSKFPVHLVLRAETGGLRQPKNFGKVATILEECAQKYGVRVYSEANVGNHIHLAIRITDIKRWAGYIRELTGRIALHTKLKWKGRPFTEVIFNWRKGFQNLKDYVELNRWEAEGHINRRETKTLRDLRAIFAG